jgi:histidyl-tRNA synthetase
LPGVGISIGLTRLFYQLQKAGLVATAASSVDVLVALMDDAQLPDALALSQRLRAAGLNVETQLEPRKLAKQLQYADRAGIRFVAIRGDNEACPRRDRGEGHAQRRAIRSGRSGSPREAAGGRAMRPVRLDGLSLTQRKLVEVAHGAQVELDASALPRVAHAADFLAEQVAREEPIYGVSTGFRQQRRQAARRAPGARR